MIPTKKQRTLVVVALTVSLYQVPAQAVIGIGDISFDPTVYGELISIYEQGVQIFDNAKRQLGTLANIQKTINEANQAYESLVNMDLKKLSDELAPRSTDGSSNRFAAMRSELDRIQSTAGSNAAYVQYQQQRLKNLESLDLLQTASASNTGRASDKTNAATSSQITAQSTSTLAALAASEEQRRMQEDMALAQSRKTEIDNLQGTRSIYEAIGMRKQLTP
jgi:hypothetical protein